MPLETPPTSSASDRSSELLERSAELSVLNESLAAVSTSSRGRLVLIAGEAGIGKTALLRRFCDEAHESARTLWGACDALFTPSPLGPFLDIAEITGSELLRLVTSSAKPYEIVAALTRDLREQKPSIVVLEDIHWADEATLDVLRLLGRKIEAVPALVVASYRDDELDWTHPLRIVLGELVSDPAIRRLAISPLSQAAVASLAAPHGVDPEDLYGKTGGNPFFVTEVLAADEEQIPRTVRDAVLARAARLSAPARALLEAISIAPPHVDSWLLEELAGEAPDALDECLASGTLRPMAGGVAFRHELARLTIQESIAPNRLRGLHRKMLAALSAPLADGPDLARLAHHAEAAGDSEAVLRFASAAAERAAALGAHREAAAQYERALRWADGAPAEIRAELLERRSYECYLTGELGRAIEAQERALELWRELGDIRGEGDSLRSLARLLGFVGRTEEGATACLQAVALLERLPPGRELALAYGKLAQRCVNWEDLPGAVAWGNHALELARRLDDMEILVYALTSIGAAEFRNGGSNGREKLERSLELARRAGLEEHAGRAFTNLVWLSVRQHSYALASRYLEAGLEYLNERDLDLWRLSLLACRARSELEQGSWTDAAYSTAIVFRDPRRWPVPRVLALIVLGLLRARRGDPDASAPIDEALRWAEPTRELQLVAPAAAAKAEAAWLAGEAREIAESTEPAFELALRTAAPWESGELACWRRRAGIEEEIPPAVAEPYRLQLAGEWLQAADLWTRIGCPYEAALALADSDDDDALRRSLAELQRLGARAAAAVVSRRLRERGARGLPRGPRPATRQNPANLTPRELEVLALLTQGLRNVDIAKRLFLSEKTVNHHVSAILRKLDVRSRGEAGAEAARLGLTVQDR